MKKIATMFLLTLAALVIVACTPTKYTVTFNSQGGSAVDPVVVEKGKPVAEPSEDPTHPGVGDKVYSFTGWYTDAAATQEYDFTAAVNGDLTLYAGWSENVVVRFNTKTTSTVPQVVLSEDGGVVQKPADPVREGFKFGGWFYSKAGLTWLEPQAVSFPLTVDKSLTLYAYWEPLNSVAANYSNDETYVTSITSDSSLILNPLVYRWSHETQYIDMMVTPLYTTEVDWDKAIADGVASKPGDFSKIIAKEFSIDALDYATVLVGAESFPRNSEDDDFLVDGKYDRDLARTKTDTVWKFTLRNDLKFQDGTPIDAYTYEYTLQQFLNKAQNNYRANIFYRSATNRNGYPILNAEQYFKGEVAWSEVGFKVDPTDKYTFTVTTSTVIPQSTAVALANAIRLVHPTKYAASLDSQGVNSRYGTPAHPFVSYGSYVLKSWDENQKLVFNKNYDYVAKGTVNYKSQVVQIVDDIDQRMQLFADGKLSVAGLNKDYYTTYAEDSRVKRSWDGYPQYLVINTAPSKKTENPNVQHELLFDTRFRQALFFGFNRLYYAASVYQPNTASILPIPKDTKQYLADLLYYSQSPEHLAVLAEFGIDPITEGYNATKAVDLFNQAYNEWIADGNTGPVTVKVLVENDPFSLGLVEYVKSSYEALFTLNNVKRLIIQIDSRDSAGVKDATTLWDFDMILASVGFGSSTGAFYQLPAFAFIGSMIGGGDLGLSQPYDLSGIDGEGAYLYEELELDLSKTYNYLLGLTEDELSERPGHELFLEWLSEEKDPETNEVTKAAGIYKGTVLDLAFYVLNGYSDDTVYDGTAKEPFSGATSDVNLITAAFERVFIEYSTLIPTVTRSSATIYANNVVIEWPEYSATFGWGAARYRYLNTDPDFKA